MTETTCAPAWIAVDWGTSNLRIWAMDDTGAVLGTRAAADAGMGGLTPDRFEPALLALLGDWLPAALPPDGLSPSLPDSPSSPLPVAPLETSQLLVIACGMVGARQGWAEAAYRATPCPPPGIAEALVVPTRDSRLDVRILPGVKQDAPPDVMRGEETQIAGFLAAEPDFDGTLCLPGTHSKWVRISAGQITDFTTAMTGELFALLAQQSVLRFSLGDNGDSWDGAAFDSAVAQVHSAPQALATQLFSLRAGSLLQGTLPATNRASLSGLLIGFELSGTRAYWQNHEVVLIGAPALTGLYRTALDHLGAKPRAVDGATLSQAGLIAAYKEFQT